MREFLDDLRASDPADFAAVVAGLAKLRNRQYHREPLCKALGDGLFELRHVGNLNTRVPWFFVKNRRIVAVHGIRKKSRAVPARDIATARERMRDGGNDWNNEKNQFRPLPRRAVAGPGVCRAL